MENTLCPPVVAFAILLKTLALFFPEVFQPLQSAGTLSKVLESYTEWLVSSCVRRCFCLQMMRLGGKECFTLNTQPGLFQIKVI